MKVYLTNFVSRVREKEFEFVNYIGINLMKSRFC